MFEHRLDMAIGARAGDDGAAARRLDPLRPVLFREPQQAQTGPIALLGCGRLARMSSTKAAVCGPTVVPHWIKRDGLHS